MGTARKPLVINAGVIEQLQAGDTLDAVVQEVELVSLTTAGAMAAGLPVYASAADTVAAAIATAYASSRVIGFVKIAAAGAGTVYVQTSGVISPATWLNISDAAALVPGSTYYLSGTSGKITATPPTSGYVTEVGVALSTLSLRINILQAVRL